MLLDELLHAARTDEFPQKVDLTAGVFVFAYLFFYKNLTRIEDFFSLQLMLCLKLCTSITRVILGSRVLRTNPSRNTKDFVFLF